MSIIYYSSSGCRELVWAGHGDSDRDGGISADRIILEMGLKGSYAVKNEGPGGVRRNREGCKTICGIADERLSVGRIILKRHDPFGSRRHIQESLGKFGNRTVNSRVNGC